ncbi:glycosyltransferase family 9 protein [Candidatus Margulisiibacteriota bacterium]
MKILISRLGMLGDTLFTLPAASNIQAKYPNAKLYFLASPPGNKLLEAFGFKGQILTYNIYYPKLTKYFLRKKLSKIQFDYFFNFDCSEEFHSFYQTTVNTKKWFRMTNKITEDGTKQLIQETGSGLKTHIVDQYNKLIEMADIPVIKKDYVFPDYQNNIEKFEKSFSKKLKSSPNNLLFGIHPGNHAYNTNTLFKDLGFIPRAWSLNNFAKLGLLLYKRYPGCKIVLTGSFYEKKLTNKIEKQLIKNNIPVINLAGRTNNLFKFLGLLKSLNLFFCTDTGPMHLAAALQVPLISIFCSADPKDTGPKGNPEYFQVVTPDMKCFPCVHTDHHEQCPPGTNCVEVLSPEIVLEKTKTFRSNKLS